MWKSLTRSSGNTACIGVHKIMKRYDIVYILKEDMDPAELIYSLRSIERNFPHGRVWFVGGQPEGLVPDGRIRHKQTGMSKWERVRSSWMEIIRNKDISDDFFLFNDDFFVMEPFKGDFVNYTGGTLEKRISGLVKAVGNSKYVKELDQARRMLINDGYDTMSFALHMPFLVNKRLVFETLSTFNSPMFRSLYGNQHHIPYRSHEDVKIFENDKDVPPSIDFLSTTEESFRHGLVGEYIREQFREPSKYEEGWDSLSRVRELYTEEGDIPR